MNQKLATARKNLEARFASLVGQDSAKEQISDILLAGAIDGFIAPALIVGPPGWGKSFFLKAIRDVVRDALGKKTLYAPRGENLGTKAEFFEEILIPRFHEKHAVVIGDEIHEAKPGVLSAIRSLLEPTAERSARVLPYNDSEVIFDPFKNSFIIATNKIDELDAALVSRFERIDLEPFTAEQMETILFNGLAADGIRFNENTLRMIAECNRGSARDIIHWLNAIRRCVQLQGKNTVNKEDCISIIRSRKAYPQGVTALELGTLLALEKRGPLQLKELASINQCSSTEQDANERYLRQLHFLSVDCQRILTGAGRDYLAFLRESKFIEEAGKIPCES